MLRITVEPEGDLVRMRLEGDLAGTWVRDLEETWRATRAGFSGRVASLDLSDVTKIDDAGRYLLALIHETGARMSSTGLETKALLESIARDWPVPESVDQGRPGAPGRPQARR